MLEESCRRSSDYFYMLLVISGILFVISNVYHIALLGPSLSCTITYIWTRRNPQTIVQIMGFLSFYAFFLPFIVPLFSLVFDGKVSIDELTGIIVGHLVFYLKDVYPRFGRDVLATPCWCHVLFGERCSRCTARGVGSAKLRRRIRDLAAAGVVVGADDASAPSSPADTPAASAARTNAGTEEDNAGAAHSTGSIARLQPQPGSPRDTEYNEESTEATAGGTVAGLDSHSDDECLTTASTESHGGARTGRTTVTLAEARAAAYSEESASVVNSSVSGASEEENAAASISTASSDMESISVPEESIGEASLPSTDGCVESSSSISEPQEKIEDADSRPQASQATTIQATTIQEEHATQATAAESPYSHAGEDDWESE